jgi:hypothetical protein
VDRGVYGKGRVVGGRVCEVGAGTGEAEAACCAAVLFLGAFWGRWGSVLVELRAVVVALECCVVLAGRCRSRLDCNACFAII